MRKKRILAFILAIVMMTANTMTVVASPIGNGVNAEVQATSIEEETVVESMEEAEDASEELETIGESVVDTEDVTETEFVEEIERETVIEASVQETVVEETTEERETKFVEEKIEAVVEKSVTAIADENGFIIENGVLTDYVGDATAIVVPGTVIEIGNQAFMDTAIVSVVLPISVEKIGNNAFTDAESLSEVVWNEGLKEIGGNAFNGCSALESISIAGTEVGKGTAVFPSTLEKA